MDPQLNDNRMRPCPESVLVRLITTASVEAHTANVPCRSGPVGRPRSFEQRRTPPGVRVKHSLARATGRLLGGPIRLANGGRGFCLTVDLPGPGIRATKDDPTIIDDPAVIILLPTGAGAGRSQRHCGSITGRPTHPASRAS